MHSFVFRTIHLTLVPCDPCLHHVLCWPARNRASVPISSLSNIQKVFFLDLCQSFNIPRPSSHRETPEYDSTSIMLYSGDGVLRRICSVCILSHSVCDCRPPSTCLLGFWVNRNLKIFLFATPPWKEWEGQGEQSLLILLPIWFCSSFFCFFDSTLNFSK